MCKSIATLAFIEKATSLHGDKYDYSEAEYINAKTPLVVICKLHGRFTPTPSNHTRVSKPTGCPECGKERSRESNLLGNKYFLAKAREKHGDKFEYLDAVKDMRDRIRIKCKKHGIFKQTTAAHLSSPTGCPECSREECFLGTDEFIKRAKAVHGDRYDYSSTVVDRVRGKVTIICRDHGEFSQEAYSHTVGVGCPKCPRSYSNPCHLYVLESKVGKTKIGITLNIDYRLASLSKKTPFAFRKAWSVLLKDFPSARSFERGVHLELAGKNSGLQGFQGATEWFDISADEAKKLIKARLSA